MGLALSPEQPKAEVFAEIESYLGKFAIDIESIDAVRPWGGFFAINESATKKFISTYFPDFDSNHITKYGGKLSPKILVVEPEQKLSWQYHNRRAELWRVVSGTVGVVTSNDNAEGPIRELGESQVVQFDALTRHRLVGLANWGVVAEIWQHTDSSNPSDEDDIVRVSDQYGR